MSSDKPLSFPQPKLKAKRLSRHAAELLINRHKVAPEAPLSEMELEVFQQLQRACGDKPSTS